MNFQQLRIQGFFVIVCFALAWATAKSFSDDSFQVAPPGKLGRAMMNERSRRKPPSGTKAGPGKIVGKCTMPGGIGSIGDGPCVEVLLILNDKTGAEVVRTRTDKSGYFMFEASDKTEYTIASGSKFVEVASPKGTVHSGQDIDLKLQQK